MLRHNKHKEECTRKMEKWDRDRIRHAHPLPVTMEKGQGKGEGYDD